MAPTLTPTLDETFLRQLLSELGEGARRFRFEVAPNPCVGAAVLAGSQVVARASHEVWGGAHAEVRALEAAARSAIPPSAWDTLAMTLEPCSTHGKTPPCTDRLIRAAGESGLKRVIVGGLDPDPRHRGRGLELLKAAGLEVVLLERSAPLERASPHFLSWVDEERRRRPRPWMIAKWAQTLTGQLSPPTEIGGGIWITGKEAQAEVQLLRGRVDAIVTGVSTVLVDNPRFTVRPPGDLSHPPMRVVLDSYLRTPPDCRLLATPGPGEAGGPVHALCQAGASPARHRALEAAGVRVIGLHPSEEDHVRLRDVQEWLWQQGARRVLLETGPSLLSRFLDEGFVDQVRIYTGNVRGGRGESMAVWLTRLKLEERLDREVGGDSVLEAFPRL